MILDSSALIAILRGEPEAEPFLTAMAGAQRILIGAPTVLETQMVLGTARRQELHAFLVGQNVDVKPFTIAHLAAAQDAFARFGRGSGSRARLKFGDCLSYALAKVSGEPLLFKGDDFTHTDITPAWTPGVG